jgi:hypothetical protein
MPSLSEGRLTFHFPDTWKVTKFDDWSFYRNQFQRLGSELRVPCSKCDAELQCLACGAKKTMGFKAVDFLARDTEHRLWLLEIKDYRTSQRTKVIDIADEVALEVRDSLAALVAAAMNANDSKEKSFAKASVRSEGFRVGLHLEQPKQHSKLFPRAIDPAKVLQRMKQLLKSIDPHPRVYENGAASSAAWTISYDA